MIIFAAITLLWISVWKDRNILLLLIVVGVLFLDKFDDLVHRLSLLVLPAVFVVTIAAKKALIWEKVRKLKVLVPYFMFFTIIAYWYFTSGLAPTIIFGGRSGEGNFLSYFRNFLNLLALLLPFFLTISLNDLKKVFTVIMWIYIVELIIVIVCYLSGKIESAIKGGVIRIGTIASLSFYVGFYVLFFGRRAFGRWIHPITYLCLLLNLFWGGGRTALVMLLLAYLWSCFTYKDNRSDVFVHRARNIKPVLAYATVLILIWVVSTEYLPSTQAERFGELLNVRQESYVGDNILGNSGRIAQWRYALLDSQWLAFGRGFTKYFDLDDYDTLIERQVETGGAHNLYVSIFYTFGYVGAGLFFVHMLIVSRKLYLFYKAKQLDETAMFICGFLIIWYLPAALFSLGISGHFFLAYFLTGYVLSFDNKLMPQHYRKLCSPQIRANHR